MSDHNEDDDDIDVHELLKNVPRTRGPFTPFFPKEDRVSTHVLVPTEMKERLERLSERMGVPQSKLLAEAVDALLLKYLIPPINPEAEARLEAAAARNAPPIQRRPISKAHVLEKPDDEDDRDDGA